MMLIVDAGGRLLPLRLIVAVVSGATILRESAYMILLEDGEKRT
jgi:hypothetical protein